MRYVAREFGFYGENTTEQALIDQIGETINDIIISVIPILYGDHDDETKVILFYQ